jgi:hypothetical protein
LDETFLHLVDRDRRLAMCYVLKLSMQEMGLVRDFNKGRKTLLWIVSPTGNVGKVRSKNPMFIVVNIGV